MRKLGLTRRILRRIGTSKYSREFDFGNFDGKMVLESHEFDKLLEHSPPRFHRIYEEVEAGRHTVVEHSTTLDLLLDRKYKGRPVELVVDPETFSFSEFLLVDIIAKPDEDHVFFFKWTGTMIFIYIVISFFYRVDRSEKVKRVQKEVSKFETTSHMIDTRSFFVNHGDMILELREFSGVGVPVNQ